MTGQDAVNVAERFAEAANFDGVVLSKLDGDSRGGAALSVKAVTGKPILYASTGEKLDDFERFHPDRMAQRILGMGDVMTLIEKAERRWTRNRPQELERKIRKQAVHARRLPRPDEAGPQHGPAPGPAEDDAGGRPQLGEHQGRRPRARPARGHHHLDDAGRAGKPQIIDGSRRRRIARGSGTSVQAVSHLVKQFAQMKKMMSQVAQGKMPNLQQLAGGR